MTPVILIPAFDPGTALLETVRALRARSPAPIVVVDDGSDRRSAWVFEAAASVADLTVLAHASNHGKGDALRTGMRHVVRHHATALGVVTADADGQHTADDILRVADALAAHPRALVLGVRRFGPGVPWRNRIGNALARRVARVLAGLTVSDSQTGLRGVPVAWIPHLVEIRSMRYAFEMEMLLWAGSRGLPVVEQRIRTIYDGAASHFAPVMDSVRIGLAITRFALESAAAAARARVPNRRPSRGAEYARPGIRLAPR